MSQATIRPKFQKATIRPNFQKVTIRSNFNKSNNLSHFPKSDNLSQVPIRCKFQKATICPKRKFVPIRKCDNSSQASIRPKLLKAAVYLQFNCQLIPFVIMNPKNLHRGMYQQSTPINWVSFCSVYAQFFGFDMQNIANYLIN